MAFTLVELCISILIIALLCAIAIPLYLTHLEEARGSKALENLSLIRSAEMLYMTENSAYTNVVADLQAYTNFPSIESDWTYTVVSTGNDNFTATATRTTANITYNAKTITIDQDSEIIIDGTKVVNGGSWP